jgi:uncharacterized delta-60 repeat protein
MKMKKGDFRFLNKFRNCLFAILLIGYQFTVFGQALDPTFQGTTQGLGTVYASVVQPDGKILVAGRFIYINNANKKSIVRLNADGSIDDSFDSGAGVSTSTISGPTTGTIYTLARQADGKILIGGSFNDYNGTARNRIARLNADGSLDTSFNPGTGASSIVRSIVVQTDGKILVGGDYSSFNGNSRGRIVRLNADGSLDAAFNQNGAGADNSIQSIVLLTDGKILIGGNFANYNNTSRTRFAKLNTDGMLDAVFSPVNIAGSIVQTISVQADGNILIGGNFTTVNSVARNCVARLIATGSLDVGFDPGSGANGQVNSLVIQTDGRILIGGAFGSYNGTTENGVVRVNSNGSLDGSFNIGTGFFPSPSPLVTTSVNVLTLQPDGKILAGGNFRGFNGIARSGIVHLSTSGGLDSAFNVNAFLNEGVQTLALQSDGKVLIGGGFAGYNGVVRNGIARLNFDGSLDTSFDPGIGLDNIVNVIAVQPDGKILIGGFFTTVGGVSRNYIARLNANGSLDSAFNVGSGANATVRAIALQTDGKILVGGDFTSFNGVTRNYAARLNTNGSLDTGFAPPIESVPGGDVKSIVLQPDGKILLAGYFMTTGAAFTTPVIRVNSNGSLDNSLTFTSDATVAAELMALQPDGKIVMTIGSPIVRLNPDGTNDATFSSPTLNGNPFALVIEPGGSILIGGAFTTVNGVSRNHIARLISNGSLDPNSFSSGSLANSFVETLAVRSGAIYLGGFFTTYNDIARVGIARLGTSGFFTGRTPFDFDGDGRADISVFRPSQNNWYLNQSTQGFRVVQFGLSTDKLAPADYDGDGKTDIAVWRENGSGNMAYFWILNSATNTVRLEQFGLTGDILMVGDWDGDGKDDLSVYRAGAQSYFFYRGSLNNPNGNVTYVPWGTTGDKPLRGDFDGDGKFDAAVFRPSNNVWYIRQSSDNSFRYENWGLASDKFVPADYDGDAKTDLAVYRNGTWYIKQSSNNQPRYEQFGLSTDTPVPADYDGDGRADITVFRGNGEWHSLRSSNSQYYVIPFGITNDKPVEAAFLP